ncbi:MAG: ABC transporter permease [Gammaproteobacteria bacterium]|nr:ABC transporter permease [Gammaproteobacteria bacterium]
MLVLVGLSLVALFGYVASLNVEALDPAHIRLTERFRPPLSPADAALEGDSRPLFGIYWLGTDDLGRDVLARFLEGARVSLSIGLVVVVIGTGIGILLGGLAGFAGHRRIGPVTLDALIMRCTDLMLCFPSFFLILTVVALLPPSVYYIMLVLGLTGWMGTARLVRAELLAIKNREYIQAARALGYSGPRILLRHALPNALSPVLVSASLTVATAILTESTLSFLGFGVQPPHATWGTMLADARLYILDAPWLVIVPSLAIFVVVLAFHLLGEGIREAADPRLGRGL